MAALTHAADRRSLGGALLLFAATAVATGGWAASMPVHCGLPMPGGWTLSMAWTRMPGQSWPGAAATFLGMWTVMMAAMMLPALLPTVRRYGRSVARTGPTRVGRLLTVAGAAYFTVWVAAGLAVFPIGATLAAIELAHPAVARQVPMAMGAVLLLCGAVQFTAFKARALACCGTRVEDGPAAAADVRSAWRHGLRVGMRCIRCCGNLMVVLLVVGVMDLAAMALVTIAIAAERLAPAGERVAHAVGVGVMGLAVWMVARTLA